MSQHNIIKAWKDDEYRQNLSEEERTLLPENPAGLMELTDEALEDLVANGASCGWSSCNTTE